MWPLLWSTEYYYYPNIYLLLCSAGIHMYNPSPSPSMEQPTVAMLRVISVYDGWFLPNSRAGSLLWLSEMEMINKQCCVTVPSSGGKKMIMPENFSVAACRDQKRNMLYYRRFWYRFPSKQPFINLLYSWLLSKVQCGKFIYKKLQVIIFLILVWKKNQNSDLLVNFSALPFNQIGKRQQTHYYLPATLRLFLMLELL